MHYLVIVVTLVFSSCAIEPTYKILADNEQEIEYLKSLAQQAISNKRLTTPENNSALLFYRKILLLDEDNEVALDGISNISEIYLSWAIESAENLRFERARKFIQRAKKADRDNPNINAVSKMLSSRENQGSKVFPLDQKAILDRDPKKINFREIADFISPKNSYIIIESPNDAMGRWIYQKLNELTSKRLEASFKIGESSLVRIFN